MNSLYISIVCLSVFYVRSLVAYPIQGTYLTGMSPGSAHTRKHGAVASPVNLSRISHLSDIYYELVEARHIDFLHDPNPVIYSRDYFLKTLSNNDPVGKGNYFKTDSADIVKREDSQVENVDSWRSKRQQGWYIQYGKRNHGTLFSTKVKDSKKANELFTYAEYVPSKNTFSSVISPLDSSSKLALANSALFKNTELLQDVDDSNSPNDINNEQFYKNDPDDNGVLVNSVSHDDLRTEKSKRQQGWFISYGKRNGADLELNFV